jgi:hypothetical protein
MSVVVGVAHPYQLPEKYTDDQGFCRRRIVGEVPNRERRVSAKRIAGS